MRSRLLPYLAVLDAAFLAALGGISASCGTTATADGGADGSPSDGPNDGLIVFETGGGCFEASTPITYTLCMDASAADACANNCSEACQRIFVTSSGCTDDGLDAGTGSATCVHTLCKGGRRPTGLRKPRAGKRAHGLDAWLAGAAWMERASVHAFERLARELGAHDAPPWLVREAKRAASDEARHARAVGKLARAHGARVPRVRFRRTSPRPLATIARENAVEGCVHEAYGALAAHVQSERATDATIRDAMKAIAVDERRHAALALALADWIEPRLTPAERARVRAAGEKAKAKLVSGLGAAPSIPAAGLIGGREARAMGQRLLASVIT